MKRNLLSSKIYYLFLIILFIMLIGNVNGATYYSRVVTGNFATLATWSTSPTGTPVNNTALVATDVFIIQSGHTITLAANQTVSEITVNSGGQLTIGGFNFTVNGTTTVSGTLLINSNTSTKTFAGLVTINSGGTWTSTSATTVGRLVFQGGITNNSTNIFSAGGATFNTNAQNLSGTGSFSFASVTVTGIILTNNGNLTVGTTLAGTGGLTNASGSILNIGSGITITTLTATADGNTVNYSRAGNQTAKVTTYSNLTISGSGTKTFATTPTVNGILLMEGAASIVVTTGVVTYGTNATLQYNKTAAYTATLEEFPATFSGTGGIMILNSGVITFGAAKNITNSLSLASGSSVNLGTFTTHTAGSLTFGGNPQLCGSWGHTNAVSATYHNNSYFASNSGYISVGSVPAAPTSVTPGSEVDICIGSGINLNATSSGNTIYWYTESTEGISIGSTASGEDFFVTPTGNTTYYSETQTPGGCVSVTRTATALITVSAPVPNFDATITDATCPTSDDGSIEITSPVPVQFNNPDYIDIGSNFLSNRNAFTLEGWIKVNLSDIGTRISLFGQNDVIEFGFMSSTSLMCWTASGGSVSANNIYPSDNGWHHVAAVGNGTNIILYIDGAQVATGGSGTGNYGTDANFTTKIGAGVWDATGGYFPGQMLKVGFWNIALDASQIGNLASDYYQYTGSETGLLAGYNFFEGTGTTLGSVITGTDGIFNGTPTWTDIYTYTWTKTGEPGFSATTKNISTLINRTLSGLQDPAMSQC